MATLYTKGATRQQGLFSQNGKLTYNGTGVGGMTWDDVEASLGALTAWDRANGQTSNSRNEREKLLERRNTLAPAHAMEEQIALSQEALMASLEAMRDVPPAAEPLKEAKTAYEGAIDDTARRQAARRSILSTFSSGYGNDTLGGF